MQVRSFNNEIMTNQKKSHGITLPIHETTFHTCIQTFERSLYVHLPQIPVGLYASARAFYLLYYI